MLIKNHIDYYTGVFLGPIIGCIGIAICCCSCSFIGQMSMRFIISVLSSVVVYVAALLFLKNEFVKEALSLIKKRT